MAFGKAAKKRYKTKEDLELEAQVEKLKVSIKALEDKGIPVPESMSKELSDLRAKLSPNKINAKKFYFEGIEYDSTREAKFAKALKESGLHFDYQVEVELQEAFKLEKESIQDICIVVDFVIEGEWFVDVKGHIMDIFKLKWKMLKHKYRDTRQYHILQKESDISSLLGLIKLRRWQDSGREIVVKNPIEDAKLIVENTDGNSFEL